MHCAKHRALRKTVSRRPGRHRMHIRPKVSRCPTAVRSRHAVFGRCRVVACGAPRSRHRLRESVWGPRLHPPPKKPPMILPTRRLAYICLSNTSRYLMAHATAENAPFRSIDAQTGEAFGPSLPVHGALEVAAACAAAQASFDSYRESVPQARALFLESIGTQIASLGDDLIKMAMRESALPRARLENERARTINQLRLFAQVVRCGDWMGLRVDPALPNRAPLPRPDLRLRMIPLGCVAVFGASNFPFAFSTAGGDSAAALAAGCPVVLKGHPAHPGTDAMVA